MSEKMQDPSQNIIILRSVWGKVNMKYFLQPTKDPKTGRLPDCVKRVDSKDDMILTEAERNSNKYFIKESETIEVQDGTVFNLEDEIQAAKWEAIKHCPLIAPDRFAKDHEGNYLIDGVMDRKSLKPRYGIGELYIYRPGAEATQRVNRKKLINTAMSYVIGDEQGLQGWLTKTRLLGKKMHNASAADVEDFLLKVAEKDPNKIIDLYTGGDTNLRLLILDAVDNKVIILKNKLYSYGTTVLGGSEQAVVTWMKDPKNKQMLALIRKDTYPQFYQEENTEDKKTK